MCNVVSLHLNVSRWIAQPMAEGVVFVVRAPLTDAGLRSWRSDGGGLVVEADVDVDEPVGTRLRFVYDRVRTVLVDHVGVRSEHATTMLRDAAVRWSLELSSDAA